MKLAFLLKIFSSFSTQIAKDKDVFYPQKAMKGDFFMPLLHLHLFCCTMSYTAYIYPKPQQDEAISAALCLSWHVTFN
jgi:hypothetical protein